MGQPCEHGCPVQVGGLRHLKAQPWQTQGVGHQLRIIDRVEGVDSQYFSDIL